MARFTIVVVIAFLATVDAHGQTSTEPPANANVPPSAIKETDDKQWSFSVSVYSYIVPNDANYAQPTVTADYGWLHLEARYNYEALKTGSARVGYNFSGGDKLTWEFTPMLGGVFGDTVGIAPGYNGSLSWRKLEVYSEGEYVLDTGDSSGSFFYNWSELAVVPRDWFRVGLVTQRTRAYETDRDIQRGLLVGFTYKKATLTTYVFNPDESKPTVVIAAGLSF